MRTHLLTTTAVLALLAASTVSTRAQTNWTGLISSDWFTAPNWTGGVPTAVTSATIDTLNRPTVVDANPRATALSLVVGRVGVGSFTIQNGGVLTTLGGGFVGAFVGRGDVTVTGPGSAWTNITGLGGAGIQVGGGVGVGTLTVDNGASVNGGFFGELITVGGAAFSPEH